MSLDLFLLSPCLLAFSDFCLPPGSLINVCCVLDTEYGKARDISESFAVVIFLQFP